MDRKSFFKGFGIGVLFAAIILGISFTIRTSDSYVEARAQKLGMAYTSEAEDDAKVKDAATSAPETTAETEAGSLETEAPEAAVDAAEATAEPEETASSSKKSKKSDSTDSDVDMEEEKEELESELRSEMQTLTVEIGDWSSDVSQKLEDLGVIDSASEFDTYLNEHGYGEDITAGTYSVSADDTFEELAERITAN